MRKFIALSWVGVALLTNPAIADSDTSDYGVDSAGSFLSACRPFASQSLNQIVSTQDTAKCWGAFAAVQQLSVIARDNGIKGVTPLLRFCAPASSTRSELISIFVKFISDHPEYYHLSFGQVSLAALQRAFPCPQPAGSETVDGN